MREVTEAEWGALMKTGETFGASGNKNFLWAWDMAAKEIVKVKV